MSAPSESLPVVVGMSGATGAIYGIRMLEVLLDRVFHRIYAGVEVDMDGLRRLRELAKHGSLVLLPSHKRHVD